MNILGERIKSLRKANSLNQEELSMALNERFGLKTDRVMISKWETGFQTPVINTIKCLAMFFGVSIDYLNGNEIVVSNNINLPSPTITEDYVSFPVIGEVAAGYDHIAVEDWEGDKIDIPCQYLKGRSKKDFFALRVKGDSMHPFYQEGDIVLVLKQSTLNYSGQVGVILYDDELASLKKVEYKMGEDWLKMVPINPTHPTKRVEGEDLEHCRILGIPKLLLREIEE